VAGVQDASKGRDSNISALRIAHLKVPRQTILRRGLPHISCFRRILYPTMGDLWVIGFL
jgi:hypothetical protein